MAATAKLTLLLPTTLTSTVSFPTRLVQKPFPLPQRLIVVAASASPSAQTLSPPPSPHTLETPEARQIRLETESALEWGGVCARLADFAATAAGRAACVEGRVAVGRSRGESEGLIEQTAAAVLLSAPLDFAGVEDVSAIVAAATGGRLLAVRQICAVGRSVQAARGLFGQLQSLAEETKDGR
jgi:allantoinase/DNA mismatch repair protein MutS2